MINKIKEDMSNLYSKEIQIKPEWSMDDNEWYKRGLQ
jgi:hypothetical protein